MKMRKKGFLLVEILIVVVVLGILACMVIPQFYDKEELKEYSEVVADMKSNYYNKIEYSFRNEEISLIREDRSKKIFELKVFKFDEEDFLSLKGLLEKGWDEKLGIWTFESKEKSLVPRVEFITCYGMRLPEK